jgi:hypothetical protein
VPTVGESAQPHVLTQAQAQEQARARVLAQTQVSANAGAAAAPGQRAVQYSATPMQAAQQAVRRIAVPVPERHGREAGGVVMPMLPPAVPTPPADCAAGAAVLALTHSLQVAQAAQAASTAAAVAGGAYAGANGHARTAGMLPPAATAPAAAAAAVAGGVGALALVRGGGGRGTGRAGGSGSGQLAGVAVDIYSCTFVDFSAILQGAGVSQGSSRTHGCNRVHRDSDVDNRCLTDSRNEPWRVGRGGWSPDDLCLQHAVETTVSRTQWYQFPNTQYPRS